MLWLVSGSKEITIPTTTTRTNPFSVYGVPDPMLGTWHIGFPLNSHNNSLICVTWSKRFYGQNVWKHWVKVVKGFFLTAGLSRDFNIIVRVMNSKQDLEYAAFPIVLEHGNFLFPKVIWRDGTPFGMCCTMSFLWNPCLLSLEIRLCSVFALALSCR